MIAEVISIGDELTSGQRLDTNSQWISERLGELGVRVFYHTTVADDLEANIAVFRTAVGRADVIVASGGLGPTADDLTREAIAATLGVELVLDESVVETIRAMFAFFQREMPERNRVQALFPRGSQVIPNPNGTAPGIAVEASRADRSPAIIYALPGVPAELFEMWRATVADDIRRRTASPLVLRHFRLKCFGAGESHIEKMLPDIIRRGREPSVGITVSGATITLRITARGATPEQCAANAQPTIDTIHQCLGDLVFGAEDDELEDAVARLLVEKRQTLATAEWGSAGQVARWLLETEGGRAFHRGGLVFNSAEATHRLLGLPETTLAECGTPAFTHAMAEASRARLQTDLGLAIGPLPDVSGSEAGKVQFALAMGDRTVVRSAPLASHPSIRRVHVAKVGLNLVRLALSRATSLE